MAPSKLSALTCIEIRADFIPPLFRLLPTDQRCEGGGGVSCVVLYSLIVPMLALRILASTSQYSLKTAADDGTDTYGSSQVKAGIVGILWDMTLLDHMPKLCHWFPTWCRTGGPRDFEHRAIVINAHILSLF